MLECCSLHFNQKIANCIVQLSNSGLKMPEKLLESCIFLVVLTSATNFLNFNVLIKKDEQQHVFATQLKLNMLETRKSKNWKFYINTVKNGFSQESSRDQFKM